MSAMKSFKLMVFAAAIFLSPSAASADNLQLPLSGDSNRPNIVFIMTDDQDLHLNSLHYMPLLKKHVTDVGTTFKRHFCTTAVCCPARVSLVTGKAAHNTNVTDVIPPYGGYPKFVAEGWNEAYLPVFLQNAGYNTYFAGKLFNAHTIHNYDSPFPKGWTNSDFLLHPYTHVYYNSTFQRGRDPPVSYEGEYSTDVLSKKATSFLEDAVAGSNKPFFLGIGTPAPHSYVGPWNLSEIEPTAGSRSGVGALLINEPKFVAQPPQPAARHAHLFPDVVVPRTDNFNPDFATGANWIHAQPKQTEQNVAFNDHFYRQRLRSLQAVDELVDSVMERLESLGVLDNTYVFYTTDNGYHIGQHRLQPGKECGFEEDINVPLLVRGPGVPAGEVAEIATTHTDLLPTFLEIANAQNRPEMDGLAIPLTKSGLESAKTSRHNHVQVEFWGFAVSEGAWGLYGSNETYWQLNNTYKAIRVVSEDYNLYYSVWCSNEHELYDLKTDPGQLNNLLHPEAEKPHVFGISIEKLVTRLDSLLLVTKSCKGETCIRPWKALHPQGDVNSLRDALLPRFDRFYKEEQRRVAYSHCELGYLLEAEGPQFEQDGVAYWEGSRWSDWL